MGDAARLVKLPILPIHVIAGYMLPYIVLGMLDGQSCPMLGGRLVVSL